MYDKSVMFQNTPLAGASMSSFIITWYTRGVRGHFSCYFRKYDHIITWVKSRHCNLQRKPYDSAVG